MIYVEIRNDNTTGIVHYMPFDKEHGLGKTESELLTTGILVESLPQPNFVEGKAPVMLYNANTKELYYEYVDRPLTPEEQAAKQLDDQKKQISQILLGNAQLTLDNETLKKQNADILLKLAKNNIN